MSNNSLSNTYAEENNPIISQLYYSLVKGDLEHLSDEMERLTAESIQAERALTETLTRKQEELFDDCLDHMNMERVQIEIERFNLGFKTGCRLCLEILPDCRSGLLSNEISRLFKEVKA